MQELASLTGRDINSHSDYMNKIQGYIPPEEQKPEQEKIPEKLPEKLQKIQVPHTAGVRDTVRSSKMADGVHSTDSGNIDQSQFVAEMTSRAGIRETDAGTPYLYLAASILISTILILSRNSRKA